MGYKILIRYETGNSFGCSDEQDYVNLRGKTLIWESLEEAKCSLKRIKDHYDWIKSYDRWSNKNLPTPDFVKRNFNKPLGTYEDRKFVETNAEMYVYLPHNQKEIKVCCFWVGYFETLYGGNILNTINDGWSFSY